MNASSVKPANNIPMSNISSFVSAPVNAIKNAANNVAVNVANGANNMANSVKNVFNANMPSDISEPINESFASSFNSDVSPFVSVPIIILLGVLIIVFIIVYMFRDTIAHGLEFVWHNVKKAWHEVKAFLDGKPSHANYPPPPPMLPEEPHIPHHKVDHHAVNKSLPGKKEVFNVAQNKYTYTDAEPLCKAFGAELATYDQVKGAWQQGADWCNYGWVKGQAAVYPTQQSTYDKLQAGPEGQRGACGVPGVNGGFFDNPEMKFGVNCYGPKPGENEADVRHTMAANGNQTHDGLEYDKKVQDYKAHMSETPVNPFNTATWSS